MKTVHLKLFKGKELTYNKHGEATNENHLIKLSDGKEWFNFLQFVNVQSYVRIDFIKVIDENKKEVNADLWIGQLKEKVVGNIELNFPKKEDPIDNEREQLKKRADEMGLKYPKAIGNDKLRKLIEDNETKE